MDQLPMKKPYFIVFNMGIISAENATLLRMSL